jgi:O-antigen/teichoic acid export membrane protein
MEARISKTSITVIAIALGSFAPGAFAYLDPSTGSMILSAIVGIFATVGLALKTYWYKLKSLFRGQKDSQTEVQGTESMSTEPETDRAGSSQG